MAYNENLAQRIREVLAGQPGLIEKKMFGGLAFMINGNMCCGIVGDDLMLRVGPERYEAALAANHVRPMDFTGRSMKGIIYVEPEGVRDKETLRSWVMQGVTYAASLPPK